MDENFEIIQAEIPVEVYEKQIVNLIETLLLIDEELFPDESGKNVPELEAA